MKAKSVAFIVLAVLLALATTPVYADTAPPLPHAFYGTVEINGSPAPVGTSVEVRGEGVETGVDNNPIVTTAEGEYGSADPMAPKLIVQGTIADGATVTFYVNGFATGQTAAWHSGEITELDVNATIEGSMLGDVNGDGLINALDITTVERIIVELDAPMTGADVNQDGTINVLDITRIERIIAGLD